MTQSPQPPSSDVTLQVPFNRLRRLTRLEGKLQTAERLGGFLGQSRAQSAVDLAATVTASGFNLFVAAPPEMRTRSSLRSLLETHASQRDAPEDWIYVNNFKKTHTPRALKLPAGKSKTVQTAIRDMIQDLRAAIPSALEKPEVQSQRRALEAKFQTRQEDAFEALGEDARANGVAILRGPLGFTLAPLKNDEVLKPEQTNALPENEQTEIKNAIETSQKKLEEIVRSVPNWERELRDGLLKLQRQTVEAAITQSIDRARSELCDLPVACQHLNDIREDLIDNVALFSDLPMAEELPDGHTSKEDFTFGFFERYDVNVFVDHNRSQTGAPVIEESHPTLSNLVGRVEHRVEDGMLTTNFKLIQPGALHIANGGFLILDARRLLSEPMSWQALKRALQSGCVKTESLAEAMSLTTTITLEPAPIPLNVKIILIGDAWIYHLLAANDPEFRELFKILADFDHEVPRDSNTEHSYALSLLELASHQGLLAPNKQALEALIEEASREAGDSERLSLVRARLMDILTEASHIASQSNQRKIRRENVEEAIAAKINRSGRIGELMHEHLIRGISLVETAGDAIGQVNGLSVFQFGGQSFGKPSRVTARTRPGQGRIVDIEREATLGGPIHSKGVMILTGYLSGRYVPDRPMSLLASVGLEQSYGGVEGDSASLAELIALLSSLCQFPIKQSLAITGAVNQLGEVQAIGGVNDKIEGFFDLCDTRGLTGEQGVIIPQSNIQHLMLRPDVVAACKCKTFHVFGVTSVDQALELLIGKPADVIHDAVDTRLTLFANVFSASASGAEMSAPERVSALPSERPGGPPSDPPSEPPREAPSQGQIKS